MAGQIHTMLVRIIPQKVRGNQIIAGSVRTRMILKGISVEQYNALSPDDPAVILKLKEIAKEFSACFRPHSVGAADLRANLVTGCFPIVNN